MDSESYDMPLRPSLQATRPAMHRRINSNSSQASDSPGTSCVSYGSEEQFAFSPAQTPASEKPCSRAITSPSTADASRAKKDGSLFGNEVSKAPQSKASMNISESMDADDPIISPSSKARPIAIESQGARSSVTDPISVPASNPPEPLSARGDIPGGFFPLHEDPKSRVRYPHPFHPDADMARRHSQQQARRASKSSTNPSSMDAADAPEHSQSPFPNDANRPMTADAPLSSYNPIGVHDDVALPLGKYYPSNWEKRHGKSGQARRPLAPSAKPAASAVQSEPQVPRYKHHGDQGHAPPSSSEARRRLQQYQRDMVAQAAMAASALLAKNPSTTGAGNASSRDAVSLARARLGSAFVKMHKPVSPRLLPLGSPGPVTPMSLEDGGYLALSRPSPGTDAERQAAGSQWADEWRQHREDARSSPTIGMSALSV
ncbi:hypothetical protein VTK56DRAFT_8358 [Thermocarpiscus australiensis]